MQQSVDSIRYDLSKTGVLRRVLLVDDDEAFRTLISAQLGRLGCGVQAVADASAFLGAVVSAQNPYDMVIVDIDLPGLTGDKIITWLQDSEEAHISSLPTLVVTGLGSALMELPEERLHRLKVLHKPFRFDDLRLAVEQLIGGRLN